MTYINFSEWALAAKEVPKEVYLLGGHTVLCLCPRHAVPGKLHTIHGHPPMRRLDSYACRTNCIPSTDIDQWEDRTHMPCQNSCIPSTFTNQWEDWTRMPCHTSCIPSTSTNQWEDWTYCLYAMPDQLHAIPSTFTDQWEDWTCTYSTGSCHTQGQLQWIHR